MHAMKKLDVLLICKLKFSVQLRYVYGNHTEQASRHEESKDDDYVHDNLAYRHLLLVHSHAWEEDEEGGRDYGEVDMIGSVAVVEKKADNLPQGVVPALHRLKLDGRNHQSNHVLEAFEVVCQVYQVTPPVGEEIDDQRE